jgi:hypothetical protein
VHWRIQIGADKSHYFDRPLTYTDFDMGRDQLRELVGDAAARVTCSFELSDKDFGSGFSAHCSVSLACNQHEVDVTRAADIASSLAVRFTSEALETVEEVYALRNKVRRDRS